jgi:hypothetical protein
MFHAPFGLIVYIRHMCSQFGLKVYGSCCLNFSSSSDSWVCARMNLKCFMYPLILVNKLDSESSQVGVLSRRKWQFCHYETWASLFCHPVNEIRSFAIIKLGTPARMPWDEFIAKFNNFFHVIFFFPI